VSTVTSVRWGLGAAESLVLRDGARAKGTDALRLAVTELILRGAARIDVRQTGWRGRTREVRIGRMTPSGDGAPVSVASVDLALQRLCAGPDDPPVPVGDLARTMLGSATADRWVRQVVVPGLVTSGLIDARRVRVMGIVPRTRLSPTPQGEHERARLLAHLAALEAIPDGTLGDPLPVIVAAGVSVLLVKEIWPQLAALRHPQSGGAVGVMGGDGGGDGQIDLPGLDFGGIGDLDLGLFDTLDSAFDGIGVDLGHGGHGGGGDGGGGHGGGH